MIKRLLECRRKDIKPFLEEIYNENLSFKTEDILQLLKTGQPEIEYWSLKIVKKFAYKFSKKEIKKFLSLNDKEFELFVKNPLIEFQFPIVGNEGGKIANGLVIELDKRIISNTRNLKDIPFLNKGYIVFFDCEFEGNSFEAALISALCLGRSNSKFLFTGSVKKDGSIVSGDVDKKRKLAQMNGKRLIFRGNINQILNLLRNKHIKIPIFIGTNSNLCDLTKLSESAETEITSVSQILSIEPQDMLLQLPANIPFTVNWESLILKSIRLISKSKASSEEISKIPIFHVGFKMPASLALGIGASVGTGKVPIVVYHYDPIQGYLPVIDLTKNPRAIKKKISSYEELEIIPLKQKNSKSCVLTIRLASHSPQSIALEELTNSVNGSLFLIEHKSNTGNLPIKKDWTKIVTELRSVVEEIHKTFSEIHLVLSLPIAIAFGLGMALGNYWDISVYQFNKSDGKYYKVLNLRNVPPL